MASVISPKKGWHTFRVRKMNGQKNYSIFGAFNRIHLRDEADRMSMPKGYHLQDVIKCFH